MTMLQCWVYFYFEYLFFFFLLSSIVIFFLHCMLNILRYKHILWNWWVDCFIARSIMWCDISGCSLWIHFTFYGVYFFLKKTVSFRLLVSCLSLRYFWQTCIHFHNILRLFHVLTNFPFTTSETMRDCYLLTWYLQVVSWIAKQLKI